MEERKLTEKESLEVITSMISRTRERYIGDGSILCMWGYLVVAVTLLVWGLYVFADCGHANWLWFAIPVIGMPVTIMMSRKQRRERGFKTYSDKVTSALWTIAGVSEVVLICVCLALQFFSGINGWIAMLAYTTVTMPLAEIASGLIVWEKSMVCGGLTGLAVGIVTIAFVGAGIPLEANWYLPLFILAFICTMIIPGHILNHKAKSA